ncbi:MAG: DUF58 domain-containing protein [Candidatus Hydrothermae bacterium]|nr:DUF58 domain-containing protein [Candidatus Hydrothermae bacterium]
MNLQELLRLPRLPVRARLVVEGTLAGMHRSPYHGFSVQFSDHRPFVPGDAIRFIDWKVYARRERLYIKQFEEETNLRAFVLLDLSRSMDYGPKWEYARTLAAALALLLHLQRDAVGLYAFSDHREEVLPARVSRAHLHRLWGVLERLRPEGRLAFPLLEGWLTHIPRRSVLFVISDGWGSLEAWTRALRWMTGGRREVLFFQVITPEEEDPSTLPAGQWEDLETGERRPVEPDRMLARYREALARQREALRETLYARRMEFHVARTDRPLEELMSLVLLRRRRWY